MASVNTTTEGTGAADDTFVNPDIPSVLSWNEEPTIEQYAKMYVFHFK